MEIKIEVSQPIFEKCSGIALHEDPFNWSPVFTSGRIYVKKRVVAFHNFANAPKNNKPL
jgi:hypothetical protein